MRNPAVIPVLALACLATLGLSACDRETETPATPPPAATADTDADPDTGSNTDVAPPPTQPPASASTDGAGDTGERSFICEDGHWVALVGGDTARVTLADGRTIEIPRKSGGVAEYRGVALSFDLDDDGQGGVLGQDGVGGFDCNITG